MPVPSPIPLYRLVHMDSLPTLLSRGTLHAPNRTPKDGLPYRAIHSTSVQASRHDNQIWCGPRGTCHDYVPFYFGPLSVMLLNLKTGRVAGYDEGQAPLIYLTTTVERVRDAHSFFRTGTGWQDSRTGTTIRLVSIKWIGILSGPGTGRTAPTITTDSAENKPSFSYGIRWIGC
jgi:hypothetical protein